MLVEAVDSNENIRTSRPYEGSWSGFGGSYDDPITEWFRQRTQRPNTTKCYRCGKDIEIPRLSLPIGPRYCEECKAAENKQKYHEGSWRVEYSDGTSGPFTGTYTRKEQTRPVKEKRTLKCIKCERELETIFAGIPQAFVCNTCQWNEYQSKEGKR